MQTSGYSAWRHQQRAAPYFFVAPFVILFVVFGLYPIGKSLYLAFHTTNGPRSIVFTGLTNFSFLLSDPDFYRAVWNTFVFAFFSIFLQLPLSLALAMLLNSRWLRGREIFRFIFFSPYLLGPVFVGVIASIIFVPRFGLLPVFLSWVSQGQIEIRWLEDPNYVMPALVLTALWMYAGYNSIYFLAALQSVDRELYEAAAVDGASRWQQFRHITLPGIKPVVLIVVIMSTIGSFQLFELPYNMLQGMPGPRKSGLTIVSYLYMRGFEIGNLGYASAVGWTLALMVLVVSLAQVKLTAGRNQ